MDADFGFSRGSFDRDSDRRDDTEHLDHLLNDGRTTVYLVCGAELPIIDAYALQTFSWDQLRPFAEGGIVVYLGRIIPTSAALDGSLFTATSERVIVPTEEAAPGSVPLINDSETIAEPAIDVQPPSAFLLILDSEQRTLLDTLIGPLQWAMARTLGEGELSPAEESVAATAAGLEAWHRHDPFCSHCGTATVIVSAGWVRRCPACSTPFFPRVDPAVIMAVIDANDRILLGHNLTWPEGRYSLLAGFVEPGESAEMAVRREVAEEAGIEVGAVRFIGSQPWPFPRSLMLTFEADALTTDIHVDGTEMGDARWFTRGELAAAVASGEIGLAPRTALAHTVIEQWHGAPLESATW
ncbi:MAG: NAD(+) diphosphatase [Propionibacteriaceae bacterium]|jgi:NADH pyrophosphatase NudC (nudix superfamily)|nr:NAD(+) diphosphatase [Propionibacteriaceae bacterium]